MNEDFEPHGPLGKVGPAIATVMSVWLLLSIISLFLIGIWPLVLWFVAHVVLSIVIDARKPK